MGTAEEQTLRASRFPGHVSVGGERGRGYPLSGPEQLTTHRKCLHRWRVGRSDEKEGYADEVIGRRALGDWSLSSMLQQAMLIGTVGQWARVAANLCSEQSTSVWF